jgi:hypothetical protein
MNKELYDKLWEIFKGLGADALAMNHYDLAELTDIESMIWKKFLMEPEVADWIKTEINLIQESELKKMIKDVNKSRSIGQAQLMNTLAKLSENKTTKEGPTFIYTYVPLNPEQAQAPNVVKLDKDIFLTEVKDA